MESVGCVWPRYHPLTTFAVAIIFNLWGNHCTPLHSFHLSVLKLFTFVVLLALIVLLHSKLKKTKLFVRQTPFNQVKDTP